jgi:hypothetical protein
LSQQGASLALLGLLHRDIDQVSIAFRLPSAEEPKAFEARLRAAGLVGGKFQVLSRATDEMWKQFIEAETDRSLKRK